MAERGRSVRVRITAVATVVVAIAVAAAGWLLVRSVEDGLQRQVAKQSRQQVAFVTGQLAAGVDPARVQVQPGAGFVQVLDASGRVITAPGSAAPFTFFADPSVLSGSGGAVVDAPVGVGGSVPGSATAAEPLDVRYDTVTVNGDKLTVVAASPLAEVERSVSTLKSSLVIGLPLLVVLVAAVTWFVVGRALRPVEAIRAEVEAITASTIHRRVPEPGGRDEVDRLARTMNAMLDRLEEAAGRQRRFVSDASHELRSPIAAIRTQVEVAARHPDGADWEAVAGSVLTEEARLEALVDDLLTLARDDEGVAPGAAPVDVREVLVAEAGRARRVPVVVEAGGPPAAVAGDRTAIASLSAHALDNAARHAASQVWVVVAVGPTHVEVTVDDDGAGVAPDDRERVFERFARLDEGRSRDRGGAGLGLSVVRAVAHRHGGTATLEASPHGGARLRVTLAR